MAHSPGESVLAFRNVSFRFEGEPVLNSVSFELRRGETMIVLGEAGSGKTVLLKTSLGLLRPESGQVLLFGEDTTGLTEQGWFDVRSRVGVLFQEGGLFDSLTIEENVGYPLLNQRQLITTEDEASKRAEQSLSFVELEHTLEKFPSELSGGMRRRVGIARAVVTEPELLLYDSPTAGLDPITATTIMELIIKGRDVRQTTTVIVTHRYQDAELMARYRYDAQQKRLERVNGSGGGGRTHFIVMKAGSVVFDGSMEELEASRDPYVMRFVRR